MLFDAWTSFWTSDVSSSSICLVYHLDPSGDARGLPRLNLCLFPGHLVRLRGALRIFHRFFCPYTKGDLELRRQNLYNRQDELAVGAWTLFSKGVR